MAHVMHAIPRLSIVIPMTTDVSDLEDTLVSVLENRPDESEIVVVLARPYADPWNIRDEVRFVQAPSNARLVSCVNLGIAASEAAVIHVLTAGWRATPGWTDAPLAILEAGDAGAVVPVVDDAGRTVSTGVRCGRGGRRLAHADDPMAPCLEVGFWRADVLDMAGNGFSLVCGDECADTDMAVTLDRIGCPVMVEPSSRVECGVERRRTNPFMAGLHAERLFWRSLAGESLLSGLPLHLYEVVRHSLARAPLGLVPAVAGRLVGLLQFGAYRQRYQQLQDLAAAAEGGEERTIRIDGPHGSLGRPKVADGRGRPATADVEQAGEPASPLRRSA
jgi:hypothetical protein